MREKIENNEICRKCGGSCCKWIPGAFHPKDFEGKDLEQVLLNGFADDHFVIDSTDRGIYVMPNVKSGVKWGTCIFFTETGCSLSYQDRPHECKMLEPRENDSCIGHSDKDKCAEAWESYRELLLEIQSML